MEEAEILLVDLMATDAWIRALSRRLVTGAEDAEDVAQDAWLRALTDRPRRQRGVPLWLFKVVRNLALSRRRSDTHRTERERAVAKPDRFPSVAAMRDQEETRTKVARAVFSLDEPYRAAILYRYFRDLPPREIADHLGVSAPAIEGRLRRGLQKLRARLDREFGDRKSWCAALLPLVGQVPTEAAAAAGVSSASLLAGALVMSTKIKIGIAVVLALGVAYAFWPRDEVEPPEVSKAEVAQPVAPVAKKSKGAEPAVAKEGEATARAAEPQPEAASRPISLEPTRGSIVGVVTDPHGAPMAGASVRAFRYMIGAVELKELLSTKTDKAGRYVLEPLEERCVLEASSAHHHTERRLAYPYTRQDFKLGKPGSLGGRILLARDRSPCPDAMVALYRHRPEDILDYPFNHRDSYAWQRPPIASVRSDGAGGYRFHDLQPGRYHLRVVPPDLPQFLSRDDAIEISPGRETIRDVAISRGFDVAGRVMDFETDEPIAGAEVYFMNNLYKRATTDRHGRYVLRGVGFEAYPVLLVRAAGYVQRLFSGSMQPPESLTERVVRNFRMSRGGVVRGSVIGPDGKPLDGARVGAVETVLQAREQLDRSPWLADYILTNEAGEFELTAGPSRKQRRVFAVREGYAWSASEPFTLPVGGERNGVVIRLERGGAVAGRVTDRSGEGVASAQITLYETRPDRATAKPQQWSRKRARSRADGSYEITGIPAGTYGLEVVPAGLPRFTESPLTWARHDGVVVSDGCRARADFMLGTGAVIAGRVVDSRGQPIQGAAIRAYLAIRRGDDTPSRSPRQVRLAITDARGRFEVRGLREAGAPHNVRADKPGFASSFVRDVAAARMDLVITLRDRKRLAGRVVLEGTGQPSCEFQVRHVQIAKRQDAKETRTGRTSQMVSRFVDLDGRFVLWLRPGTHELEAETWDGRRSEATTVVIPEEGEPEAIEIHVRPGATLRGSVSAPLKKVPLESLPGPGYPLFATVAVYDLEKHPARFLRSTDTDSARRFNLGTLPPGTYLLHAASNNVGLYLEATACVRMQAQGEQDVTLSLRSDREVQVRVTGSDRKPVENAAVAVGRCDGAPFALNLSRRRIGEAFIDAHHRAGRRLDYETYSTGRREYTTRRLTLTDRDGRLAPLLLLPGDYVVQATARGYKPRKKTVKIGSGGTQTVEIELENE